MDYEIVERIPSVDEHRALFEAVGWEPYTPEEATLALANTLYGVVAIHEGETIAMGRVIGDQGKFYYVQDVAVQPAYQGQGVGHALMDRIMAYIKAAAPGNPFVGLFATEVAISFYRQYGFAPREESLSGMWLVMMPEPQEKA
jgi:ribosomal protein S18 acetylase RimI-like enzyme